MNAALRRSPTFGPYAVLFDTGFYGTAFGPALPFLASAFGVSLGTAGLLLTALFAGSITSSALLAWLGHRTDQRIVGVAGLVLIGLGLAGIGLVPYWPMALGAAVLLGIGDGLNVAAAHMLVAAAGGDLARSMSRLNIVFAVGAAAGPLWAGFLFAAGAHRAAVYCIMLAIPMLAAAALAAGPQAQPHPAPAVLAGNGRIRPIIVVMGIVLLVYVGAEIGLGTWVSSYTEKAFGSGVVAGALVTAGYWAALGIGRITGTSLLSRGLTSHRLLAIAITGALGASILLSLASGIFALGAAGALLAGLCFGPIWPCALGIASQDASPRIPAILVTVGNAGGLFVPLLQGAVLDSSGPRAGMAITAVLCAVMLVAVGAGGKSE